MNTLIINTPHVISEVFDDEAIVAHLSNGVYYHIKGSGVPIWQWIVQGISETDIEKRTEETFTDADLKAVQDFVQELEKEELLKRVPESEQSASTPSSERIAFIAPSMERFTDMQELLLLDPIHEVGDEGWPKKDS